MKRAPRGVVGRRPITKTKGGREVSFNEWMKEPNQLVTREDLVAFSQFQFEQQTMPMMTRLLQRYDRESRWYRRAWHWLRDMADRYRNRHQPGVDAGRAYLDELRAARDDSALEASAPEPSRPTVKTCVVCGSPRTRAGKDGPECENGHQLGATAAEAVADDQDHLAVHQHLRDQLKADAQAAVRDGRAPSTGFTETAAESEAPEAP